MDDRRAFSIKVVFAVKIPEMIPFPQLFVALTLAVRVHLELYRLYQARALDI